MKQQRTFEQIAADVRSAKAGDMDAMNRILADVQDMVYYNCLKMLRTPQAAEDATQEILIRVYQKIGTLTDPLAYIGWVKRLTANHCKNCLSKVNKEFLLSETEDGEDPFASFEELDEQRVPDKALDNEETRRMIVSLVDSLPDEQRMCVMLYYYDELKTREIAEALNVSEGTIKSRLNYARKSIKEGVKAYEAQGVKLYGFTPIPFLGYFLGKAAVSTSSPILIANITAAATATTAAAATTSTSTAATGGFAAFLSGTVGKVVAGITVAAVLGGVGTGVVLAAKQPSVPATAIVLEATEEPTALPTETPEPTLKPTPEPTQMPETPEETLERLAELSAKEAVYLLDTLRGILSGENELGWITESPIVKIWEIHSLQAYRAYRETEAWKDDVSESELACYGILLEDGTELWLYLGDGLPVDGRIEHAWVIYRIWLPNRGEYLYKLDYLEGPQWTEWSTEKPPEDALETETRTERRLRKVQSITVLIGVSSYYNESEFRADADGRANGELMFRSGEGFIGIAHSGDVLVEETPWTEIGESSSPDAYTDIVTYSDIVNYRTEWNEETGNYTVWMRSYYRAGLYTLYTRWTGWYESGTPIDESSVYSGSGAQTETQERTLYRYRRR